MDLQIIIIIIKDKEGPEAMAKFLIVMCICDIFATVAGH